MKHDDPRGLKRCIEKGISLPDTLTLMGAVIELDYEQNGGRLEVVENEVDVSLCHPPPVATSPLVTRNLEKVSDTRLDADSAPAAEGRAKNLVEGELAT